MTVQPLVAELTCRVLGKRLKALGVDMRVLFMSADVSVMNRKAYVDAFQQDPGSDTDLEADTLVLPTKVYGKGFTTTRAKRIIIIDLAWLEETYLQGIKRVHLIGSLNDVLTYMLSKIERFEKWGRRDCWQFAQAS